MHPRNQAVADAVRAAGIEPRIRILDVHATTAVMAAEALGCPVGAIANSLVFDCDGAPLLVMASGAERVDTALVAGALGAGRIRRAKPDFVLAATGQVIGGVAPTGHPAPLRTVVDEGLAAYDEIWTAAGTADSVMALTYADLVILTGGQPMAVR